MLRSLLAVLLLLILLMRLTRLMQLLVAAPGCDKNFCVANVLAKHQIPGVALALPGRMPQPQASTARFVFYFYLQET